MNKAPNDFLADAAKVMGVALLEKLKIEHRLNDSGLLKLLTSTASKIVAEGPDGLFPASVWSRVDREILRPKLRSALEIYKKKDESSSYFREKLSKSGEVSRHNLVEYISNDFQEFRNSASTVQEFVEMSYELRSMPGIMVHVVQRFERARLYQVVASVLFNRETKQALQILLNKSGLCTQFIGDCPRREQNGFWSIGSEIFHGSTGSSGRDNSSAFAFGYYDSSTKAANNSDTASSGLIALSLSDSFS